MNDPSPLPVGSTGTVRRTTFGELAQIDVEWDNGRTLMLVPSDPFATRKETDPCERGTPGCSVWHGLPNADGRNPYGQCMSGHQYFRGGCPACAHDMTSEVGCATW
jgi:hypothetical protein